jgi:8-oxo-dGTP diphosphatase
MIKNPKQRASQIIQQHPWLIKSVYPFYRFLRPRYNAGVVGLVSNQQGEILLVEHVFHPQIPWGLPGGWTNRNEDPAQAVQRELYEELGLEVEILRPLSIERTEPYHLDIAFLCEARSDITQLCYELLSYRWYHPSELPRLHKFHYRTIQAYIKSLR